MLIKKTVAIAAVAALAGGAMLGLAGPASASSPAPIGASDIHARFPGILVDSSFDAARGVQVMGHGGSGLQGTLDTDDDSSGTRVVDCDRWRNAVALPGSWLTSTGCSMIGTTNSTAVFYSWERTGGSSGSTGCVQGKGFNAHREPVWQNAGCATTSGGTAILWGNVAATKQVRFHTTLGNNMQFQWR